MPFSEREFQEACSQLNNPDVSEYEFFVESMGVKIYRKYNEVRLIDYKLMCVTKFYIKVPQNFLTSMIFVSSSARQVISGLQLQNFGTFALRA